jgi:hypothetical protein
MMICLAQSMVITSPRGDITMAQSPGRPLGQAGPELDSRGVRHYYYPVDSVVTIYFSLASDSDSDF